MSESTLHYTDLDSTLRELAGASRWYVGFSGGLDSTVLLHLLHRWCAQNPAPPLCAIHINHGMQSAAREWQAQCEAQCAELGLPCTSRLVDVCLDGRGAEAAAREARYRVFEQILDPGAVLFLGHHLDDQVETFFLRLMRGAGLEGLAAMPHSRALGAAMLARPLLDVSRGRIEAYAVEHGIRYVEDPSNGDTAIDRNFLRAEVLPQLARRWPSYRQTVTRASGHMAAAVETMRDSLGVPATVFSTMGDPGVSLGRLTAASGEAALNLRAWLQTRGCQAPDRSLLDEFLRQLRESAPDASPRMACAAYSLQRYRDAVYLLPAPGTNAPGESVSLAPGAYCDIPGVGRVGLQPTTGEGLLLSDEDSLRLCWRRGGERCQPRGRAAGTGLKKLLQEWDVPPWWRDRVPLLYLGEELLAVGDLALCESGRWRASSPAAGTLWSLVWERVENGAGD